MRYALSDAASYNHHTQTILVRVGVRFYNDFLKHFLHEALLRATDCAPEDVVFEIACSNEPVC